MTHQAEAFASSTGQVMTGSTHLDIHFEAARPEYEAQLRAVGIQRGWNVLDAASGSGSFLPWIAELVGSDGRLSVVDLAPENVELIKRRLAGWSLSCSVETRVGSVLALPYPDDAFDAVWFANTSQYLTDDELTTALAEFQRVVCPGGLVALKETDVTMYRVYPAPPGVILRWFQATAAIGITRLVGALRAEALPSWLRRSGLVDVRQRSTMIERSQPIDDASRSLYGNVIRYLSATAADLDLPAVDHEFWRQFDDPTALARFLEHLDLWVAECNVLTVGVVPTAGSTLG
jgi:ubiquinone/menaquinone biosynthesis C-methylase UbiE